MKKRETVLQYIERDRLRYINLLEIMRRGSGELRYAGQDGVLLWDKDSGAYLLSAQGQIAFDAMLGLIPAGADLLVAHEDWYLPALRERLGLTGGLVCHQVAWMEPEPPAPAPFRGEICPLDLSFTARVREIYDHAYAGEDYIAEVIERGMLGAFINGALAGFIGTHDEGTMGLLQVLPEYRRQGVAEALYRANIRRVLAMGGYALGHVEVGNEPSLALQRKVGMAISEHLIYWLF